MDYQSLMLRPVPTSSAVRGNNNAFNFEHIVRLLAPLKLGSEAEAGCNSPLTAEAMRTNAIMFKQLMLPHLQALLPGSMIRCIEHSAFASAFDQRRFAQLCLAAYAATNNMVGYGEIVSLEVLIDCISEPILALAGGFATPSLRLTPSDLSTLMPMAESVFRSAIQSGNCDIAKMILSRPELRIDINGPVNGIYQSPMTPLALAACSQQYEMIMMLLELGADPNLNLDQRDHHLSLDHVIDRKWENCQKSRPQLLATVKLLLQKGARLADKPCFVIASRDCTVDMDLMRILVPAFPKKSYLDWFGARGPKSFLSLPNEDDVLWILDHASAGFIPDTVEHGWRSSYDQKSDLNKQRFYNEIMARLAHLNGVRRCQGMGVIENDLLWILDCASAGFVTDARRSSCCSADSRSGDELHHIDIAVLRGHLNVVRRLQSMGASFTDDTLVVAIRNKDEKILEYLTTCGLSSNCYSQTFNTWPVVEALRMGQETISGALRSLGFQDPGENPGSCCALLQTIVSLGDAHFLIELLRSKSAELLGRTCIQKAIYHAISNDFENLAMMLLNADPGIFTYNDDLQNVRPEVTWHNVLCSIDVHYSTDVLAAALQKRNVELVDALLDHGFVGSAALQTDALELATAWGNAPVIGELCTLNLPFGESLAIAVENGDMECLRLLLRLGAGSQRHHTPANVALQVAICHENEEALLELLKHGIDPKESRAFTLAVDLSSKLFETLIQAAEKQLLLSAMQPPDYDFALTALASAIMKNKPDHMRKLLELGVRVDICKVNLWGRETLHVRNRWNCEFPKPDAVYFKHAERKTWRHPAIYDGERGFAYGDGVYSPLGLAVLKDDGRDLRTAQVILEAGAKNGINIDGLAKVVVRTSSTQIGDTHAKATALLNAVRTKELEMVQLLLKYGAGVNTQAVRGFRRTPLQAAAEVGSKNIVQLLLSKRAEVNAAPAIRGGATALQLAAIGGYIGIAELLLDNGADILAPGAKVHGRTALEGAAEHGRTDMVQFLIRWTEHPTYQLDSAIAFATNQGHAVIATMLRGFLSQRQASELRIQTSLQGPSVRTRTQRRPTCRECARTFRNNFSLRRHQAYVHGEDRYECPTCLESFARPDNLKRHEETHKDDDHISCPACDRHFSRRDYLATHMKSCINSQGVNLEKGDT